MSSRITIQCSLANHKNFHGAILWKKTNNKMSSNLFVHQNVYSEPPPLTQVTPVTGE